MSSRTFEAYRSTELFRTGLGQVVVFRNRPNGLCEAGVFLVDVFCLGIKNGFYQQVSISESDALLKKIYQDQAYQPISPACARKLVEDAIAYARNLGLAPHPDAKKAARVLGGINAGDCQERFTFGQEGKPLYIQGPHDSPSFVSQVMIALRNRCGKDGFHYILSAGESVLEPDEPDEPGH
jgi:hypothetical protein